MIARSIEDIHKMRTSCRIAAEVLESVVSIVKKGISTFELDSYAKDIIAQKGAISATIGYKGKESDPPFPGHVCTSVNNVVCHGVPDKNTILRKGDIVNIDVTTIYDGYHGDTSRTVMVGRVAAETAKLVKNTELALLAGIHAVKPGGCISDIGLAIENFIKPFGYGIVEELTGHGIGIKFHEDPSIFHFHNKHYKKKLIPGMIFTIEPMINLGSKDIVMSEDGWSILTKDGSVSAQFEHTILVTSSGADILTSI